MQAILIMAALMVFSITTVSGKCDPFLIQINIYDDEGCKTINTLATQGAKISEEDAKNFNECNAVRAGSQTIYTKNVCDAFTFTIGMYSNAQCSKILNFAGIKPKYVFDWNRCYRRSAS